MDSGADCYRRFLDGDDDGIVCVIRDYKDGLILFLDRYVNNIYAAEELAEDVFFKLVTKKPRFTGKYSFKTWLYTIGRNAAINHLRRNTAAQLPSDEALSDGKLLEREYLRTERRLAVHAALGRISPDYSRVLHLIYFEDMDNEQAAHVMGKSKRQIENLVYRAKQALRSEIMREGFSYEDL